jgi:hypothetical protein
MFGVFAFLKASGVVLLKRFWKSCKGGELFQILLTDGDGSIAKS